MAMQGISLNLKRAPDPHWGRVKCIDCHSVDKPQQKPDDYARKCAGCHEEPYAKLFYSWTETFSRNRLNAEHKLENIIDKKNHEHLMYERKIEEAGLINFHNLNLAQEVWKDLLKSQ